MRSRLLAFALVLSVTACAAQQQEFLAPATVGPLPQMRMQAPPGADRQYAANASTTSNGLNASCAELDRFGAGQFDSDQIVFGVAKDEWNENTKNYLDKKNVACFMEKYDQFARGNALPQLSAHQHLVTEKVAAIVKANAERRAAAANANRRIQEDKQQEENKVKEAKAKEARYRSTYENISSPDAARRFIDDYSGSYDPDHLVQSAMRKGYEGGAREAERCIDFANRRIQNQKEIAATVGYVDKTVMYEAGATLVQCRRQRDDYVSKLQQR